MIFHVRVNGLGGGGEVIGVVESGVGMGMVRGNGLGV